MDPTRFCVGKTETLSNEKAWTKPVFLEMKKEGMVAFDYHKSSAGDYGISPATSPMWDVGCKEEEEMPKLTMSTSLASHSLGRTNC